MKLAGAYINDDKYERLVALAESNNRTLAGQCRHLFDRALNGELQVPPYVPLPVVRSPRAAGVAPNPAVSHGMAATVAVQPVPAAAAANGRRGVRTMRRAQGGPVL